MKQIYFRPYGGESLRPFVEFVESACFVVESFGLIMFELDSGLLFGVCKL